MIQDPNVINPTKNIILDFLSVSTLVQYQDTCFEWDSIPWVECSIHGFFSVYWYLQQKRKCTAWPSKDFQLPNVTRFHCTRTRVILFKPGRKLRPSFLPPTFTELTNAQQHYAQTSRTEYHPNRHLICEVRVEIYLRRPCNIWLSHCPLSRNAVTSSVYGRLLYRTLPRSEEGQNLICSRSKAWFSLHWFARNSHLLSDVTSISYVPDFTWMGY